MKHKELMLMLSKAGALLKVMDDPKSTKEDRIKACGDVMDNVTITPELRKMLPPDFEGMMKQLLEKASRDDRT